MRRNWYSPIDQNVSTEQFHHPVIANWNPKGPSKKNEYFKLISFLNIEKSKHVAQRKRTLCPL